VDVLVDGTIPAGAGLSSSSALVVAFGTLANDMSAVGLDAPALMELMAAAERYVGTEGGGMDQAASIGGRAGGVMMIRFFPLGIEYIPFPEGYTTVVCHSLVSAHKAAGANAAYNQRVVECRLGTAMIAAAVAPDVAARGVVLRPGDLVEMSALSLGQADEVLARVFDRDVYTLAEISTALGMTETAARERFFRKKDGTLFMPAKDELRPRQRLRHVFREAQRVKSGAELLRSGQARAFGALMDLSHESCARDYEISCAELDALVGTARAHGAVGARLTGAGFGGCTINLVERRAASAFMEAMSADYYRSRLHDRSGLEPYMFECRPAAGAGRVENAVRAVR
jgi:N-acetylgalactosamine kinase